jgi:hypothetical protein
MDGCGQRKDGPDLVLTRDLWGYTEAVTERTRLVAADMGNSSQILDIF